MTENSPVHKVVSLLVTERFGPAPRPDHEPDTPQAIRERQLLLASMPGDEEPEEKAVP
jgi:hypothetical protein